MGEGNRDISGTYPHFYIAQKGMDRTALFWQRTLLSHLGKGSCCQETACSNLQLNVRAISDKRPDSQNRQVLTGDFRA
jgi:hypothetical protein